MKITTVKASAKKKQLFGRICRKGVSVMNTENVVEKGAVYASVYGELADAIGEENMKKVYDLYRGVKVDFPKRMYAKQYVINQLKNLAGKKSVSELARKFDYSERYIRKLLAEGREGGKEV